jgi:hypothetical protein
MPHLVLDTFFCIFVVVTQFSGPVKAGFSVLQRLDMYIPGQVVVVEPLFNPGAFVSTEKLLHKSGRGPCEPSPIPT